MLNISGRRNETALPILQQTSLSPIDIHGGFGYTLKLVKRNLYDLLKDVNNGENIKLFNGLISVYKDEDRIEIYNNYTKIIYYKDGNVKFYNAKGEMVHEVIPD